MRGLSFGETSPRLRDSISREALLAGDAQIKQAFFYIEEESMRLYLYDGHEASYNNVIGFIPVTPDPGY